MIATSLRVLIIKVLVFIPSNLFSNRDSVDTMATKCSYIALSHKENNKTILLDTS